MWPRKKWPHLFRFLKAAFMGIFLGARQRRLWVLSVTQLPSRPEAGHSPPLGFSCVHCLPHPAAAFSCQSQNPELNRRDGREDTFIASHFLLHKGCKAIPPLPSVYYTEKLQEGEGKCLIFECLPCGYCNRSYTDCTACTFGTFCKPENVAGRLQLSVLLQEWRRQHFFEVLASSSFLVCFHLI